MKKAELATLILTIVLSLSGAFAAVETTKVSEDQMAAIKDKLATKGLVLDSDVLSYTSGPYIVKFHPKDPDTGQDEELYILDATQLGDTGEIRWLTEGNEDLKISKPLLEEFKKA